MRLNTTRLALFGTTSLTTVFLTTTFVSAQTASSPAVLETVIVTAEKEVTDIQKTPVSITALSGDTFETQGEFRLGDVLRDVPGIGEDKRNNNPIYIIRGIGIAAAAASPLVGQFLDGGYTEQGYVVEEQTFDVARVEVLKGPQGTLYGRNTVGGAVNIITNDPTDKLESSGSLQLGNYNEILGQGMFNVPIDDEFALRVAFADGKHGSFYTVAHSSAQGEDDQDYTATRVKLLYHPTDSLKVLVGGDWTINNNHGGGDVPELAYHKNDPWQSEAQYCAPGNIDPATGVADKNENAVIGVTPVCLSTQRHDAVWHLRTEVDDDLGWSQTTFLYNHEDQRNKANDLFGIDIPTGPGTDVGRGDAAEFRLANPTDSDMKWVGGLYWNRNFHQTTILNLGNDVAGPSPRTTQTMSAFGQVTVPVVDRFRITGGLRYNADSLNGDNERILVTTKVIQAPGILDFSKDWNKLTWKGGAEFDLAPSSLLYANVATGYSAGNVASGVQCAPGEIALSVANGGGCSVNGLKPKKDNGVAFLYPVDPVQLINYEAGVKNRFFNDTLQFNSAVFFSRYSNLAISALGKNAANLNSQVFQQIHGSKVYGAEIESSWLASADDRFDLSLEYLHSEVGDPNNPWHTAVTGCLPDPNPIIAASLDNAPEGGCHPAVKASDSLVGTPEFAVNLAYQHIFELANSATLTVQGMEHLESSSWVQYEHRPENENPAYHMTNLSLTYQPAMGNWLIAAWVRNLEDHPVITGGSGGSAGQITGVTLGDPRTWGVTMSLHM